MRCEMCMVEEGRVSCRFCRTNIETNVDMIMSQEKEKVAHSGSL